MLGNSIWIRAAGTCILAGCAGLVWIATAAVSRGPAALLLSIAPRALPADGVSRASVIVRDAAGRRLSVGRVSLDVVVGNHSARVVSMREEDGRIAAEIEAGVVPGTAVLEARAEGMLPARAELTTRLDPSDRAGDGTPDFLRLDSPSDRDAFRRWFTFVAEAQAFAPAAALPREIVDCAALARFAYREALRPHDAAWAEPLHLAALPAIPAIEKYAYPFTPLGAGLFRVRPGPFLASDGMDGTFAEFADAKTLSRFNAFFVTRKVERAQPGDLFFYRQHSESEPYHTMIFLGASQFEPGQFEPGRESWVIYHTGPLRDGPGEIRRVALEELLGHPEPRWRPVPGNPYFLGVYRWNILRGVE
ncbi:MAG TPA: DUF1175 family protein [Candidatus Acidoferrales bacterium]|nr:DUF1175 family protein [Candidatus Acidoferrales bacterium]